MSVSDYIPSRAWIAANNVDVDALRVALDAGADVDERDWDGVTLLMLAVDSEACLQDDNVPLRVDCTSLLLARGADVRLVNERGESALDWAGGGRHWLAFELLRAWDARTTTS
jgi:ankyrin repeat protein